MVKLCVMFMLGGVPVLGNDIKGWGCRPYKTMKACVKRRDYAQSRPIKNYEDALWFCAYDRDKK